MICKLYQFTISKNLNFHPINGYSRYFSSDTGELPVIKIPKYLEQNLGNAIYKEHKKVKEYRQRPKPKTNLDPEHMNKLLISWTGDKKLFHYYGKRYNPEKMPLISKYFLKETYNGERMTFHNFSNNPSLMQVHANQENTFESLGLSEMLMKSIHNLVNNGKPVEPSSIQFGVIPLILQNRNVILSAETGSGKTIAYLAPIIQMIDEQKRYATKSRLRSPYGMVILPSRELTEQVGSVAQQLASNTSVGVATIIGGLPKNLSHSGMDLVVTTIGMVEPHINRGVYSLRNLNHLVLDEADTLLDDTFSYEVVEFLEQLNLNTRSKLVDLPVDEEDENKLPLIGTQVICSSATLPITLDSTIGSFLSLSEDIEQVTTTCLHSLHSNIKHIFYRINRYHKDTKLIELLIENKEKRRETIIFANRTNTVNWLYHFLNESNFTCSRLTSEMSEEERHQSFRQFQTGQVDILVATDLGSRGLDTIRVRHVINFDCPHYTSDYIHRSGRTGRLGSRGTNIVSTLVSYKPDGYMLIELERAIRLRQPIESINANIRSQLSQHRVDKLNKLRRNV